MIRLAIVGYGFMGGVHAAIIHKHPEAVLKAVVEIDAQRLQQQTRGNVKVDEQNSIDLFDGVDLYSELEPVLERDDIDCIAVCLPTYLHDSFANRCLKAGKDVIVEKPMALSLSACDSMIKQARENDRMLFVGQCIRFWPEYVILKEMIALEKMGKLLSLGLRRVGAPPAWAGKKSWFFQEEKSGGCVFDLHVHDTDYIHYAVGNPTALCSRGLMDATGLNRALLTHYYFDEELICYAEGSWKYHAPFKMSYSAVFEQGQLEYDSSQTPTLQQWKTGGGQSKFPKVPAGDGYFHQYDYIIDCLKTRQTNEKLDSVSVRNSIAIALAEKKSMMKNEIVHIQYSF
jgi:predicted dehydrogenase